MNTYKRQLNLLCALLLLPFPAQFLTGLFSAWLIGFKPSYRYVMMQAVYPLLFISMVCAGFFLLFKKAPASVIFRKKAKIRDILFCLFIFLMLTTFAAQLFVLLAYLLDPNDIWIGSYQANTPQPSGITEYFLYTVVICILPAVCEEYIYRGLVIGVLGRRNERAAVLLSAFFFALMHGTLQQIPVAFCAGLALGYFYIRYRSLTLCIILHFCNNFFSLTYPVICKYIPSAVIWCLLIVLGAASLICYLRFYWVKEEKPEAPLPCVLKDCAECCMFWIYAAAFILYTVYINALLLK